MINHEAMWHNLKENPDELPTKTSWYVVKIKGSDDLGIVYGYETISAERYDSWLMVSCPY